MQIKREFKNENNSDKKKTDYPGPGKYDPSNMTTNSMPQLK